MKIFVIQDAQASLAQLVELAMRGDDIIITYNNSPAVRLVPYAAGNSNALAPSQSSNDSTEWSSNIEDFLSGSSGDD